MQPKPLGIAARVPKSRLGCVHGGDLEILAFVSEGESDGAAPSAPIENSVLGASKLERPLDHDLGLGSGNEDARTNLELEPPKRPPPEDVGHWLAGSPPPEQLPEGRPLFLGERTLVLGVDSDALNPERMGSEQIRIEPRRLRAALGQIRARPAGSLAEREEMDRLARTSSVRPYEGALSQTNSVSGPCRNSLISSARSKMAGTSPTGSCSA